MNQIILTVNPVKEIYVIILGGSLNAQPKSNMINKVNSKPEPSSQYYSQNLTFLKSYSKKKGNLIKSNNQLTTPDRKLFLR